MSEREVSDFPNTHLIGCLLSANEVSARRVRIAAL